MDIRGLKTFLSILITLGMFLAIENLGAFLHVFQHPELHASSKHQFVIATVPALVAVLLVIALLYLARTMTREGQLRLADRSRVAEEWQQTFNSMTDLVSVHDRDFRIIKANSALCEFFGKKPEDIIGRTCYRLFHDRHAPISGCPHSKAHAVGHAVTMEINDPFLAVPLLITCSPLFDQAGAFAGSVHTARIQTQTDTRKDPRPFIPICASCKDIRDENGKWLKIEEYVSRRFNGRLTHGVCKECQKRIYPELFRAKQPTRQRQGSDHPRPEAAD